MAQSETKQETFIAMPGLAHIWYLPPPQTYNGSPHESNFDTVAIPT